MMLWNAAVLYMSDSSIRAEWHNGEHYRRTNDPRYRVEMVTPKLTYDEMEKFQECVRRVRQTGGKVNESCGMHVHVDASNHNRQSLKNLLSVMYSKEDLLFKALKTNPDAEHDPPHDGADLRTAGWQHGRTRGRAHSRSG